jgi:hypothetical protein
LDSDAAGTQQDIFIRVNGVSTSVYSYHQIRGEGTSVYAIGGASQTYAYSYDTVTGNAAGANTLGAIILDIHDYGNTSKNKTLRLFGGFDNNGSGQIVLNSNLFNSTNALSSISFTSGGSGNWTTQTQLALYGVKGA